MSIFSRQKTEYAVTRDYKKSAKQTLQTAVGLLILAVVAVSTIAAPAQALPGDTTWSVAPGQGGVNRDWTSVSMSADGTKIIAGTSNDYLYVSTDSGATWIEQTGLGIGNWYVAVSNDGTKLAAYDGTSTNRTVYVSSDFGVIWNEMNNAAPQALAVAISNDGTKVALAGPYIYISTDSGATFTQNASSAPRRYAVSMSGDGTKIASPGYSRYIHTSNDSGLTWTERTSAGSRFWTSLAMTDDGTKLVATASSGYVYTSKDSGATWTEQTALGSRSWIASAISADGKRIAVGVGAAGYIYTSSDSGATWTEDDSLGQHSWRSMEMSADGTRLAAAEWGGAIYLGTPEGPATDTFDLATLTNSDNIDKTLSEAQLSITSSTCYTISDNTVDLHDTSGLVNPTDVKLLGGIGFELSCADAGGDAPMTVTLGSYIEDLSTLHIYKETNGTLTDITDQLTITNADGVTTIEYTLVDGGDFDEDGTANSVIVDPLYVGVTSQDDTTTVDDSGSTAATDGGELASTGVNTYLLATVALLGLIGGVVVARRLA